MSFFNNDRAYIQTCIAKVCEYAYDMYVNLSKKVRSSAFDFITQPIGKSKDQHGANSVTTIIHVRYCSLGSACCVYDIESTYDG